MSELLIANCHRRISKLFDADIQPTLEQVKVIGAYGNNQLPHQEQGNAGVFSH